MPIYEYECLRCESTFERRQGFHEPPASACPTCGAEARRVYRPIGVIFKGPGFYITDSRPKPKEESSSAASDVPTKSESTAGAAASKSSAGDAA